MGNIIGVEINSVKNIKYIKKMSLNAQIKMAEISIIDLQWMIANIKFTIGDGYLLLPDLKLDLSSNLSHHKIIIFRLLCILLLQVVLTLSIL